MGSYNKFMLYFWLIIFIAITGIVTVMGFLEGFDRWAYNYTFSVIALFAFLSRRFMIKRMEKHLKWLEENQPNASGNNQ